MSADRHTSGAFAETMQPYDNGNLGKHSNNGNFGDNSKQQNNNHTFYDSCPFNNWQLRKTTIKYTIL